MISKYAFSVKGKGFIKSFGICIGDGDEKFTDDIDKATLISEKSLRNGISTFAHFEYDLVKVIICRSPIDPIPASEMLEEELDKMQIEFDVLDVRAEADIDAMKEKDYRRWKRLKRCLEFGVVDNENYELT